LKLKHYLRLSWRWSWLVVLSAALAGTVAYILSGYVVPTYAASTSLLINQAPATTLSPDINSLRTNEGLARTYVELLNKRPVLEEVVANLHLDIDPGDLQKEVDVTLIPSTQLLMITVEAPDPQRAAKIANEIVRVFSTQNQEFQARRYANAKQSLQQELARIQADMNVTQAKLEAMKTFTSTADLAEQSQLRIIVAQYSSNYASVLNNYESVLLAEAQSTDNLKVVEAAMPPSTPIRPRTLLNIILAAFVGSALSFGLVLLVDHLDDSIKSSEDVGELIGISTLAAIGRISASKLPNKLVTSRKTNARFGEVYRLLRTNIEFSAADRHIRTLIVTSSNRLEGKSITAANLAIVLAQKGKRIILVDANLRRPMLHKFFQQPNTSGVTTALLQRGHVPATDLLVSTDVDNLYVLPSGPLPPNPTELLGSQQMYDLVEELKEHADLVIFDSPPLLPVVDAMVLAHICDAALLVVMAGATRPDALRRARDQLAQSGTYTLGVVLNRISTSNTDYYQQYNYSATMSRERGDPPWRGLAQLFHHSTNGHNSNRGHYGPAEAVEQPESAEIASSQQLLPVNGNSHHPDLVPAGTNKSEDLHDATIDSSDVEEITTAPDHVAGVDGQSHELDGMPSARGHKRRAPSKTAEQAKALDIDQNISDSDT